MRCPVKSGCFLLFGFIAVALVGLNLAHADALTWVPTTGGLFNTPGNWSGVSAGPPGSGDTALFNSTATQTVIFQSDVHLDSYEIENGNTTFQLNQTNSFLSSGGSGLVVGEIAAQTGRLTILN